MEVTALGLSKLAGLLRERELSAPELTRACLEKIRREDGRYRSFLTVCEERAMAQAAAAQKRLDQGEGGPLTGLPLAVKDNICIEGVRTTCASKMLANYRPPYTATAVERLERAGMVVLGKTNMDEFGMGSTSMTSYAGGPKNPLDPQRVAGGSSGGSAAAVAAGFVPAALGSDTGGSVRQPAAFCGLAGLRPTYGAVSRFGLIAFASSMDQIGPMARSAADCGLLFGAMAGKDPRDATTCSSPWDDACAAGRLTGDGAALKGRVIGLPVEFFEELPADVEKCMEEAASAFVRMGCSLRKVSLPGYRYAVTAYYLLSSAEAASNLARYDGVRYGLRAQGESYEELAARTRREGFGKEVKRRILLGNYALSSGYYDRYYKKAQAVRRKIRAEYDGLFTACDFLLTPTVPALPEKIGTSKSPAETYAADLCTQPGSLAGLPVLSVTAGYGKEGLPVGLSLTGRPFREAELVAAGAAYEAYTNGGRAV